MKTKLFHKNARQQQNNLFGSLIKGLLIIAVFFFITGCEEDNSIQAVSLGSFQYTAYNTAGTPIISGWMTIDIQDSAGAAGEWHFSKIGDPEDIGPCIGEGSLVGSFNNGHLHINLNPRYHDNNVFLIGNIQADKYEGEWVWGGFAGIISTGNFIAVRQ